MTETENNIGKVPIAFKGTEEYREMLKRAALDRKIKVQTLLEKAVAIFLSTSDPGPDQPSAQLNVGSKASTLSPWHTMLSLVLESGSRDDRKTVKELLEYYASKVSEHASGTEPKRIEDHKGPHRKNSKAKSSRKNAPGRAQKRKEETEAGHSQG